MTEGFDALIDRRGTGSAKWSHHGDDVLPMWVADMDFAAAPAIVDAIRERLEHPVFGYASPKDEVIDEVRAYLRRAYGWEVEAEAIMFLPGVVPAFNMTMKAFMQPGDGVVVEHPVYPPMRAAPGHWGLELEKVDMVRGETGWSSDTERLDAAIAANGMYLLCNPQNPTGKAYTPAELTHLAEVCLANDTLIVSDEIHCDLMLDGRRHTPIATLSPEVAQRTVTLMAASKTYNIAGLKTSFAIVPTAEMRTRLLGARSGMVSGVSPLGLEATRAAYRDCGAWLDELLVYLAANRDHLHARLAAEIPEVVARPAEATYLAWLDCSSLGLSSPYRFFLEEAKVGFSPGADFGEDYGQFVRFNFGCPRALLDEGIDRMVAALKAR